MAITINGVVCQEEVNGNSESFDILTGPQATKVFICAWNSRWSVITGLLGLNSAASIGGAITLQLPARYPDFQQTAVSLYASSVSVQGIGSPYQNTYSVGYTDARIIVNYRSMPWSFQGLSQNDFNNQIDPAHPYVYAEQNMSFTSEAITVSGRFTYFSSDLTKPTGADWGFRSPLVNFNIALKYVPYIPAAAIITATAAPINSTTYLGVSAGKLLFNGCETHQTRMSDGSLTQEAAYSFSYRPIAPWDYSFNGATNAWEKVVDSAGNPIQQRSDLTSIIPTYYDM